MNRNRLSLTSHLNLGSLTVFLSFTAIALFVTFPVHDFDTFWHLAYGRAMVEQGRFINHEIFSYTAAGKYLGSHSQLAQVLLYLVDDHLGANGLIGFKALLTLGTCALLFRTARLMGTPPIWAALLCLSAVTIGGTRFTVRPQLFSYLGIALLGLMLHGFRQGKLSPRVLAALPLVFIAWDYLHGAPYGLLLLGAFVSGESIKALLPSRLCSSPGMQPMPAGRLRSLWLWTVITIAATIVNPNGLLNYRGFGSVVTLASEFSTYAEFMPTYRLEGFHAFWIFLVITLLAMLLDRRRFDLTHLLVFLPFAFLAIRYNRAVLVFALATIPLLAAHTLALFSPATRSRTSKALGWALAATAAGGGLTFLVYVKLLAPPNNLSFGLGLNENLFPTGSARFVKETGLSGNLFNSDIFGGYLAYSLGPERKIFHYNLPGVFDAYPNFLHNARNRERWDINYALLGKPEEGLLFDNGRYATVYWEGSGRVLVRRDEKNARVIQDHEILYFNPALSNKDLRQMGRTPGVGPRLLREMATHLSFRHDRRLADLFGEMVAQNVSALGTVAAAEKLRGALRHNPDSPLLHAVRGETVYRQGHLSEAAAHLRAALEKAPDLDPARLTLAYLNYDQKDFSQALTLFKTLVRKNPDNADAIYGLALTNYRLGNMTDAKDGFETFLQLTPNGPFADKARAFLDQIR